MGIREQLAIPIMEIALYFAVWQGADEKSLGRDGVVWNSKKTSSECIKGDAFGL
jgi:hypothetical protein